MVVLLDRDGDHSVKHEPSTCQRLPLLGSQTKYSINMEESDFAFESTCGRGYYWLTNHQRLWEEPLPERSRENVIGRMNNNSMRKRGIEVIFTKKLYKIPLLSLLLLLLAYSILSDHYSSQQRQLKFGYPFYRYLNYDSQQLDNNNLAQPRRSDNNIKFFQTYWSINFITVVAGAQVAPLDNSNKSVPQQKLLSFNNYTTTNQPPKSALKNTQKIIIKTSSGLNPISKNRKTSNNLVNFAILRQQQQQGEGDSQLTSSTRQQQQNNSTDGLQIAITPRSSVIRVPVESNAILKCLISSHSDRFVKKFDINWSRYMYDENVYEQIESFSHQTQQSAELKQDEPQGGEQQQVGADSVKSVSSIQIDSVSGSVEGSENGYDSSAKPINRQQQLRDFLHRVRAERNQISDLLIEATLSISPVKASDNATYYCTATASDHMGAYGEQNQAQIDLVVLSRPIVRFERVQPSRDSKSALLSWFVISDGNNQIKKTILMIRNDTKIGQGYNLNKQDNTSSMEQENSADSVSSVVLDSDYNQWQRIELDEIGQAEVSQSQQSTSATDGGDSYETNAFKHSIQQNQNNGDADVTSIGFGVASQSSQDNYIYEQKQQRDRWRQRDQQNYARNVINKRRSFNLTSLLPSVTYNFRLAAINDLGQSNWTHFTATMPNEIPAQISEVFLLSRSNDSLAIGWRRPAYDNAKTLRYEMQLFDLNRTLTLDANTNTSAISSRTNFMYIFVNLNPGTDYHFHIRACSRAGCSAFSNPKLLASTLDGESDEPLDVELSCVLNINHQQMLEYLQDETPAQVRSGDFYETRLGSEQRIGGGSIGNLSASWLPPINVRGQLVNYSISFEATARYRNESGQWQMDEWRSTMETGDNHTLSVESLGVLQPNTNYSVRVCANNRSKHCGKQSLLTSRTRCLTPPELPHEIPQLGLQFKPISNSKQSSLNNNSSTLDTNSRSIQDLQHKQTVESLVLDLPHITRRNGTIDCIQIVLIKLPKSFNGSLALLTPNYLPDRPRDIKLSNFIDTLNSQTSQDQRVGDVNDIISNEEQPKKQTYGHGKPEATTDRAVAYLAEEIDQSILSNDDFIVHDGHQEIILGDGNQQVCSHRSTPGLRQQRQSNQAQHTHEPTKSQVFDGRLDPQTYYTGFIKLMTIRKTPQGLALKDPDAQYQTLTKYSNYFLPAKTGNQVIDIPLLNGESTQTIFDGFNLSQNPFRLTNQMNFQEMASRLGSSLRFSLGHLYNTSSSYLAKNVKLDTIGNFIVNSSPLMQLFEVGIIVLVLSLLLLSVIYLLTLPASMRRKRKRKMKRKLLKHQEAAVSAAAIPTGPVCHSESQTKCMSNTMDMTYAGGYMMNRDQYHQHHQQIQSSSTPAGYEDESQIEQLNAQEDQQLQLEQQEAYHQSEDNPIVDDGSKVSMHQHQHQHQQLQQQQQHTTYGSTIMRPDHPGCLIHSSPMHHLHHHQQQRHIPTDSNGAGYICQQLPPGSTSSTVIKKQPVCSQQQHITTTCNGQHQAAHQHHHQHSSSNNAQSVNHQAHMSGDTAITARKEEQQQQHQQQLMYERNCRTTRRMTTTTNGNNMSSGNGGSDAAMPLMDSIPMQPGGVVSGAIVKNHYTLSHQSSIMALSKKINKSIPLRMFGSVFECRIRNGWLKEEYEQLPRQQIFINPNEENSKLNQNNLSIKLRPQLVVSRNDSVSALISGNEVYDASLIKLGLISNGVIEKNIICAKSPMDADSVWDFWRMVYEQEVSTMVMLTQVEDPNTGDLRCAQYWPTCDNEETTILSPCNEFVQKSSILPAKFIIRQETLDEESMEDFKVRRLTLMVMATKVGENEQNAADNLSAAGGDAADGDAETNRANEKASNLPPATTPDDGDEEELIIVERNILHLQFFHWNTSNLANQMRLIKFIEFANEKHSLTLQQQRQLESPTSTVIQTNPMLVHCYNGLGRSGLFTTMSYIMDDLAIKLRNQDLQQHMDQQQPQRLNIFQLVARLRSQREMLLSPYRLYELVYQLTSNCIPIQDFQAHQTIAHYHHHHHRPTQQQQQQQQHVQQQQYKHHQHEPNSTLTAN